MKHGIVVGFQARLSVILRSIGGSEIEVECVVDTGFEGFLTLPPTVVADLGLSYLASIRANLADNSHVLTNVLEPHATFSRVILASQIPA